MSIPTKDADHEDWPQSPFLCPGAEVRKGDRHLPHWRLDGAFYFLTWRLADSLPQEKLRAWEAERTAWLARHPKPWDSRTTEDYRDRFPKRMDAWLDAGYGACHLRNSECASVVASALQFFDGDRYELASFVVMPNHVHVLFQLRENHLLEKVAQSWKGFTARQINKSLGRTGRLWQQESWDTLLRGLPHLERCLSYIQQNPSKANLKSGEYVLYEAPGFREAIGMDDSME
ncbi:MAG: transposase [Verrucomicrobiales bacterium]